MLKRAPDMTMLFTLRVIRGAGTDLAAPDDNARCVERLLESRGFSIAPTPEYADPFYNEVFVNGQAAAVMSAIQELGIVDGFKLECGDDCKAACRLRGPDECAEVPYCQRQSANICGPYGAGRVL
jgi:hypothetical protein